MNRTLLTMPGKLVSAILDYLDKKKRRSWVIIDELESVNKLRASTNESIFI